MQFGRPLIDFQNVQMTIAQMAVQIEAARLLVLRASSEAGDGLPDTYQVSVAKCFANEMAKQVTDLAMQLHGGNGYTEEYGLERGCTATPTAGPSPEAPPAIQRVRIASELLGRTFNQRRSAPPTAPRDHRRRPLRTAGPLPAVPRMRPAPSP